ncbi:MAG: RNA polymerase sigma factor [Candidatus Krumholzibacteriia bacterium]
MNADALSLDELCARSQRGDPEAESALFDSLRVRFLALAKRRVQPDHIEDVVQDALKIVFDRYRERKQGVGILVWSLTVLRNVIGNYYQTRRRERDRMEFVEEYPRDAGFTSDPLAGALDEEGRSALEDAIAELSCRFPRCGRIFHHLLKSLERGGSPNQVSGRALAAFREEHPDVTRGGFYTALHRCRANLRAIWDQHGGEPNHE